MRPLVRTVSGAVLAVMALAACAGPLAPQAAPGEPGVPAPNPGITAAGGGGPAAGAPLTVEVSSVEIRPEGHPEDAAVRYQLRLTNRGPSLLFVRMDLDGLRGSDDQGMEYEDYWSQAERNNAEGCSCTTCRVPNFARLTNLAVPLAGGAAREVVLFLNPVDASGNCERSGRARGRVDPATTAIDVDLPDISYRPDGTAPISGLQVRLEP